MTFAARFLAGRDFVRNDVGRGGASGISMGDGRYNIGCLTSHHSQSAADARLGCHHYDGEGESSFGAMRQDSCHTTSGTGRHLITALAETAGAGQNQRSPIELCESDPHRLVPRKLPDSIVTFVYPMISLDQHVDGYDAATSPVQSLGSPGVERRRS